MGQIHTPVALADVHGDKSASSRALVSITIQRQQRIIFIISDSRQNTHRVTPTSDDHSKFLFDLKAI